MTEENKPEETTLDKILDTSGIAIGASMAMKGIIAGANYPTIGLGYLMPYFGMRILKYSYHFAKNPLKSLRIKTIYRHVSDSIRNVLPLKERKIPAGVGILATTAGYIADYSI